MTARAEEREPLRVVVAPTIPPSPHEAGVLAAIASGAFSMADLLAVDTWSARDVATTMRRHGLAATSTGAIVRADVSMSSALLDVALHSPSAQVRKQAERVRAHSVELARQLAAEHAGARATEVRRRQILALQLWIEYLHQAETEARAELRRLGAIHRKKSSSP